MRLPSAACRPGLDLILSNDHQGQLSTLLLQSLPNPDDDPWPAGAGLAALLITGLDAGDNPTSTAGARLSDESGSSTTAPKPAWGRCMYGPGYYSWQCLPAFAFMLPAAVLQGIALSLTASRFKKSL